MYTTYQTLSDNFTNPVPVLVPRKLWKTILLMENDHLYQALNQEII